mmetsp:Transcript_26084/g.51056  ORF Transcript_26084/g.51056 Transcript_26084/m.51056 type:complete len:84 (+) Transcript_26084:295-546(+)
MGYPSPTCHVKAFSELKSADLAAHAMVEFAATQAVGVVLASKTRLHSCLVEEPPQSTPLKARASARKRRTREPSLSAVVSVPS